MRVRLATLLLLPLAACATPRAPARASPRLGQRLVLSAPDLAGRQVDVGAAEGTVRVVDFWATWCEPCRESFPALDALARELGPRGLTVHAVSFDEDETLIPGFLEEVPVGFPVLWDRGGDLLAGRFAVARLPTTLVVDRKGVIRAVHEGWTDDSARDLRRELERLLEER